MVRLVRNPGTKKEPVEGQHRLYAFLTTEPNPQQSHAGDPHHPE
jgi:hypothetical protein